LRGEERIALRLDTQEPVVKTTRRTRTRQEIAPQDMALWEALKQRRKALADANDVPPYVIFHDATLLDMVHMRPLEAETFLLINGVGQSKLQKYGAEFLRVIKQHDASVV